MPPKRRKKINRRKKSTQRPYGIAALSLFAAASLIGFLYIVFLRGPAPLPQSPETTEKRRPEIPYEEPGPSPRTRELPKPAPKNKRQGALVPKPRVAILIDDMGYRKDTGEKMLALDLNLSFSFLPFGPHTGALARLAQKRGRDILLHLPLEATDPKWDPGPGTLYLSMSDKAMRAQFKKDLAAVPMALGVNNHMGSRFTESRQAMATLLEMVKARGLFFIDSLTSSHSVAGEMARQAGVRTVPRSIFLDNVREKKKIIRQLDALVRLAEKRGWAVGIGHPYPVTLAALTEYQGRLNGKVALVGARAMVDRHEE